MGSAPVLPTSDRPPPSGDGLLEFAGRHLGQQYLLGARAPMANPNWTGPWDCAEFVSWCVFQYSGSLFGTQPLDDPILADAYTGYWASQAEREGCTIAWADAAAITGAILLRKPAPGLNGHIVIADGRGGTLEAHGSRRGVCRAEVGGRRWDHGILVPGIDYFRSDEDVGELPPPRLVLRVTHPLMRGQNVLKLQQQLEAGGFPVGRPDGIYGPQTAHAVELFQAHAGIVVDGEAGPATRAALEP